MDGPSSGAAQWARDQNVVWPGSFHIVWICSRLHLHSSTLIIFHRNRHSYKWTRCTEISKELMQYIWRAVQQIQKHWCIWRDALYTTTRELEIMQAHGRNTNAGNKIHSIHVYPAAQHVVDAFIQNSLWCNACIFSARNLSGNKIKGWEM